MGSLDFIETLNFCYTNAQRELFKVGKLGPIWAKKYPNLFDDADVEICRNQCDKGWHFFEWLGAILLYESTGYLTCVEKYWSEKSHPNKYAIYEAMVPKAARDLLDNSDGGLPDLFCYDSDRSDWFFCEAKGKDQLIPSQLKLLPELHAITNRRIFLMQFNLVKL